MVLVLVICFSYVAMTVGQMIFSAPLFFLFLSVVAALVGWFGGQSAYDAIGTVVGMGGLIAVCIGFGVMFLRGPVIGFIVFTVILFPVVVLDGLRTEYTEHAHMQTWPEVVAEREAKVRAEMEVHARELAEAEAPVYAPPKVVYSAPTTPQPYVLKSWVN